MPPPPHTPILHSPSPFLPMALIYWKIMDPPLTFLYQKLYFVLSHVQFISILNLVIMLLISGESLSGKVFLLSIYVIIGTQIQDLTFIIINIIGIFIELLNV